MAKKETNPTEETAEKIEQQTPEKAASKKSSRKKSEPKPNPWEEKYNAEHDAHLRLAADYDNYRKRTAKEKDQSYGMGKADAIEKLLPVYDNLERALNQPTEDIAYKKGVEMTMTQLVGIFTGLGVDIYGEPGDIFDPNLHNAVMHTEDDSVAENTITQVFQKGIKLGDKIIRFAMVQVAN